MNWIIFSELYVSVGTYFALLILLPRCLWKFWKAESKTVKTFGVLVTKFAFMVALWPLAILYVAGDSDNEDSSSMADNFWGFTATAAVVCFIYIAGKSFFGISQEDLLANRDARADAIANYEGRSDDVSPEEKIALLSAILSIDAREENARFQAALRAINESWKAENQDSSYGSLEEKLLVERVRGIPAKNYSENASIYKRLAKLAPTNQLYDDKYRYYEIMGSGTRESAKRKLASAEAAYSSCVDRKTDSYLYDCKRSCQSDPVMTYCGLKYEALGKSVIGSGCTGFIKRAGGYTGQVEKCVSNACEIEFEVSMDIGRSCRSDSTLSDREETIIKINSFEDYQTYKSLL